MESVNYEYFDSENDYSKNPNATKHRSFNVSRGDFSKYAILNGFYGKKLISRDARKFYSSMCRMAVKKEKGFYVISDEYEFAETSYKNVISFAMGMLATRIIANEIYNINKLYHYPSYCRVYHLAYLGWIYLYGNCVSSCNADIWKGERTAA